MSARHVSHTVGGSSPSRAVWRGGGGVGPPSRRASEQHQSPPPPLSPLVRRLALGILGGSYLTIILLWTKGLPDAGTHHHHHYPGDHHGIDAPASLLLQQRPRYQALRHHHSSQRHGLPEGVGAGAEAGAEAVHPLFEGANGLAVPVPLHLLPGRPAAAEEGEEEEAARAVEAAAGEAETARVRALETPGEAKEKDREQKESAEQQQQQQQQQQQPQPQPQPPPLSSTQQEAAGANDVWTAEREAAHAEYGVRHFGLRPTSWMTTTTTTDSCSGDEENEELDFTLVSQTSPDRLWMLPYLCRRWGGPFVLAVYMQGFTEVHEAMIEQAPCPNARVIRVRPPPRPLDDLSPEEAAEWDGIWAEPDHFPVNALRNLAIEEVTTSHFLLTDMDLWPAEGMHALLRGLASPQSLETRRAFLDPKQAFVAPAFGFFGPERLGEDGLVYPPDPNTVPADMASLRACAAPSRKKGECIVFDSQYNLQGHGTTDTRYWMEEQGPAELHPIGCFRSNRYEPYLLLRRCPGTSPPFAEAFTGYGKNKIEHVAHLRFRGFRFAVLPPGAFLIHFPHAPSKSKRSWLDGNSNDDSQPQGGGSHRQRMDALYDHFLSWAMQERAAREGDMVRLCPPSPPPPPPEKEEESKGDLTSVA